MNDLKNFEQFEDIKETFYVVSTIIDNKMVFYKWLGMGVSLGVIWVYTPSKASIMAKEYAISIAKKLNNGKMDEYLHGLTKRKFYATKVEGTYKTTQV